MPTLLEKSRPVSAHAHFQRKLVEAFTEASHETDELPEQFQALPPTLYDFSSKFPVKVDGAPMDFEQHRYLRPLYEQTRFDQGDHFTGVAMTGAQVGKTIWNINAVIMAAASRYGRSFGYFLPDQNMSDIFSSQRWIPIMRSNPLFASLSGTLMKKMGRGEDRKRVRSFGASTIYFWYMGGKTSTESLPMSGTFFDEVRRMHDADVQRAMERMSHCPYPIDIKISTAAYPDSDIHQWFKKTNQQYFHTKCKCKDGIVLAERWPDCVGVKGKDTYFYRCPVCSTAITDPQRGQYVPRMPERPDLGFHIPQILSPVLTAGRLFRKYQEAPDRQEFMNSGLGLPWVDPTSIMVPLEVAMACVDRDLRWAQTGVGCFMGVDQRGGENHVVIGDIHASTGTKLRLRHLQICQGEGRQVFAELYSLMKRFDVDVCVIDALPSYNEAVSFAKTFAKRVFLAYYSEGEHMARWSDRDKELKALKKAKPDSKFEHHVMLDRYKSLEWTLTKWVNRQVVCPNERGLSQSVKVHGVERMSHICLGDPETHEQGLFYHLRSSAKRRIEVFKADVEKRERIETGEFRMVFENIGVDPHFLHAMNYCSIASSRHTGTTGLWVPDMETKKVMPIDIQLAKPEMPKGQAADVSVLTEGLKHIMKPSPVDGTCSACVSFDAERAFCKARKFGTKAEYPACESYEMIQIERPAR